MTHTAQKFADYPRPCLYLASADRRSQIHLVHAKCVMDFKLVDLEEQKLSIGSAETYRAPEKEKSIGPEHFAGNGLPTTNPLQTGFAIPQANATGRYIVPHRNKPGSGAADMNVRSDDEATPEIELMQNGITSLSTSKPKAQSNWALTHNQDLEVLMGRA